MIGMDEETIVGIVRNVQAKPAGHLTVKNCDLVFTERRILVVNTGSSSLVGAMAGLAVAGPAGAVAAGMATAGASESNRANRKGLSPDEILAADSSNFFIPIDRVERATLGTGFFSTLWMYAPLKIWYGDKTFFCNVPYSDLAAARPVVESALPGIEIK